MSVTKFVERFRQLRQRYGLRALPARGVKKARRAIRDGWRRLAMDANHVFVYDAPVPDGLLPDNMRVEKCHRTEDIPKHALDKMVEELGPSATEWLQKEFAARSVLWLLYVDGEFSVRLLTRQGQYYEHWFVPLEDDDFVFMAVGTFEQWRGKGLAPLLQRHIMAREMRTGGRAFVDCKVWNTSAQRAFEKSGFRRIGTMKKGWEKHRTRDWLSVALKRRMR